MSKQKLFLFYTLIFVIITADIYPQSPQRKDVPDKFKWNLSDMYKSVEDWKSDIQKVEAGIVLVQREMEIGVN